jgi:integrator complex subunit 11
VEIDKKTTLEVKCKVKHLSFSAHADAKGIMQIIHQVEPKNVLLVHGEKGKM